MKKYLIVLLLFSAFGLKAQNYKFALLSGLEAGNPKAGVYLDSVITSINSDKEIKFVIIDGNITSRGRDSEFEKAKAILSKLKIPYYLIPGEKDLAWNQSGGLSITDNFDDDKFAFDYGNEKFIGLNSSLLWQRGKGHFRPEDLKWLDEQISQTSKDKRIIFYVFNPFGNIDNWFKAINILRKGNIKLAVVGKTNDYGIFDSNGLRTLSIPSVFQDTVSKFWKYTVAEVNDDSLNIFERTKSDSLNFIYSLSLSDTLQIPEVDSAEFENYATKVLWRKSLNTTFVAAPIVAEGKILTVDYDGLLTCFDSEGKKLWDFDTFGNVASSPAVKDGYVVVATLQGDLFTLNFKTGEEIQSIGFDDAITSGLLLIDYNGSKELMVPKQTNSKAAVVFGTSSGKVYCYDVETLQEYWENTAPKDLIKTTPIAVKDKIIFPSLDTYLYCLDAREGWMIWKWRMTNDYRKSPVFSSPVTDGKFIYLASPDENIYKIDLLLGKTIWAVSKYNAFESIGLSNDLSRVFVKSRKDKFFVVPVKTGKWGIEYKLNFGEDTTPTTPLEYNNTIFISTQSGNIYRIKNKKYKKILFNGTASPFTLLRVKDSSFGSINCDGSIVLFNYEENN